jgi:hypothetical protein
LLAGHTTTQDEQEGNEDHRTGPDQEQIERRWQIVAGAEGMDRNQAHRHHDTEGAV